MDFGGFIDRFFSIDVGIDLAKLFFQILIGGAGIAICTAGYKHFLEKRLIINKRRLEIYFDVQKLLKRYSIIPLVAEYAKSNPMAREYQFFDNFKNIETMKLGQMLDEVAIATFAFPENVVEEIRSENDRLSICISQVLMKDLKTKDKEEGMKSLRKLGEDLRVYKGNVTSAFRSFLDLYK